MPHTSLPMPSTKRILLLGYERIRTYTEGLSETRRTLGRSRFSCDPSLGVLPPDAAVPVHVEKTESKYPHFRDYWKYRNLHRTNSSVVYGVHPNSSTFQLISIGKYQLKMTWGMKAVISSLPLLVLPSFLYRCGFIWKNLKNSSPIRNQSIRNSFHPR